MTRQKQNVDTMTGDDLNIAVTIYKAKEPSTEVQSLVSCTEATYAVREQPGGPTLFGPKLKTTGGITLSGTPADGTLTIAINSADTQALVVEDVQDYYHELELVIAGKISTAFTGRFRLRKSVAGAGST